MDCDSPYADLDNNLSPKAKHAWETYIYAFWEPGQTMTVGEIKDSIRKLYGEETYKELEQYMNDRIKAILPKK